MGTSCVKVVSSSPKSFFFHGINFTNKNYQYA